MLRNKILKFLDFTDKVRMQTYKYYQKLEPKFMKTQKILDSKFSQA